ncbi:MAG: AAA family ATPase, partial [Acidobacteria bacterium]|nr:AAA family ATPase [Acidobacteriota bacterium]
MSIRLTVEQEKIVGAPLEQKIFLRGAYGTGKTTCGVRRMRHLIESGVPAHSIVVVTPQRRLALPYLAEQRNPRRKAGADVSIVTLSSLAHQALKLFWPLIAEPLKLEAPFRPPLFLSLELVQYLMFKVVDPVIESRDFFNSVKISRPRLFSQLADNLNKSSLVGFPHEQIAARLRAALPGDEERLHIFEDAQTCANLFRDYCAAHNLLDFSRLIEVFNTHLWLHEITQNYFTRRYQHLIADHLEEDSPVTHDLLRAWLPHCQSALLIYDEEAGYRRFLGADEKSAEELSKACDTQFTLTKPRVMKPDVQALQSELRAVMDDAPLPADESRSAHAAVALELTPVSHSRFHTQMLDWMCDNIARLVQEQEVKPSQIVILAPLLG